MHQDIIAHAPDNHQALVRVTRGRQVLEDMGRAHKAAWNDTMVRLHAQGLNDQDLQAAVAAAETGGSALDTYLGEILLDEQRDRADLPTGPAPEPTILLEFPVAEATFVRSALSQHSRSYEMALRTTTVPEVRERYLHEMREGQRLSTVVSTAINQAA